ncbi:hypothetical protein A3D77_00615 [Candidatus Gottesmanbacteria bacterium RIFCSPHIGHO2_02_FULL_39_11]|uniref:PIN domain-containing protein n=1 Tax=Candidatus Gottesmanbacteria bacterium RIFCSPHIGHO2_02_FULL_39_11 TaxID=1798382 RepID=A0A1F5ZL47_9BACT|nr:MAG: hypothetical protein A3D77_00615 [Candidatus Gottesmanbacteria bacterium RIFCSPHIGHO2_02_FULL_39_11]
MYLLDTDILIWLIRKDPTTIHWFEKLRQEGVAALSVLSVTEVYKGIFKSELQETEKMIQTCTLYDVTYPIAKQAGFYWNQFHKDLKKLGIVDCLIAATARENGFILLTDNTRHFPMKDISILSPVSSVS